MTPFVEMASRPLYLEAGTFGLLLLVFATGFARRSRTSRLPGWITLAGLSILAAASAIALPGQTAFGGTFDLDGISLFLKTLFFSSAALSVLAGLGLQSEAMTRRSVEYHLTLLGSLLGMLVLASARDLILVFVSFELMSIPLYVLAGFERKGETAGEGALKFFLVGSVSSAIILYGLSFVYGATGSMAIAAIGPALDARHPLLLLGLVLALAGLGFKIAAVPFHMWVPDTYESAPTPFVAWLSVAPKAAGFIVLIRLYVEGAGPAMAKWVPAIAGIATVTIVLGNLMAIPQQNIKRLLGYSGIAHIGYLLMGIVAMSASGIGMLLFYLVAYLFGNMGAFFVVQAVAGSEKSDQIEAYSGLARRSPALALSLLVFLLSLGGIPFMAGFWAKFFVFWAVVERGMYWLAFVGAVATVVALYYYLVVAKRMYIDPPPRPDAIRVPAVLLVAIVLCAAGVVIMGAYPSPWVTAATRAASSIF
ncbi:MAG TPA: NADH-quinone oxidoreductase subunit N [Vicinamibacterales bacterium]|nr:NADH-quinone oxidoreductase subunit N [Vicinamibacterales bacterium]